MYIYIYIYLYIYIYIYGPPQSTTGIRIDQLSTGQETQVCKDGMLMDRVIHLVKLCISAVRKETIEVDAFPSKQRPETLSIKAQICKSTNLSSNPKLFSLLIMRNICFAWLILRHLRCCLIISISVPL